MLRRIPALLIAVVLMISLASCRGSNEVQPEEQIDYEIAMVTESGMIMNGGASEAAWETISEFGGSNGISHKYYKASEASDDSYGQAIDAAVAGGAKIVIADGYSFSQVIYDKQEEYPDVKFVIIDAVPTDAESGDTVIGKNTAGLSFDPTQAGYLAGYAAVKDRMTDLGFIGAEKQPVIMDYGYGFLQGADRAAAERGVSVDVRYHYLTEDEEREDVVKIADEWYGAGIQAIFACGSDMEPPVIESAEKLGGKVIACDTDKSAMSDTVVLSTVRDIPTALEDILEQYADGEFPGTETIRYDVANEGVGLAMENSRLSNFSEDDYERLLEMFREDTVSVKDHSAGDISSLGLSNVRVIE